MTLVPLALLALVVSATSAAQSTAVLQPGARPPVASARPSDSLHPLGVPGLVPVSAPQAAPQQAPPPVGVIARTAPAAIDQPARHSNRPKGLVSPPAPQIVLQSGVNATMGIAFDHPNRILTPFAHPEVKTNSTASISVEDSIVYVSSSSDDPISMFIHDHDHGDPAISLTLIPEEIPAVSTQIRLSGMGQDGTSPEWGHAAANPEPASNQLAHTFETTNPYVETLVSMMKDLAHGRVPEGYSFTALRGYSPLMPVCTMPGLQLQPAQLLGGSAFDVIVVRGSNVGVAPVEVKEDGCIGDRVRAVAAWPDRVVRPGSSTEIYIVMARPDTEGAGSSESVRPVVAGTR